MDLLDMIPAYGPDGKALDSKKEDWTKLGRMPRKEEINYSRTDDTMLLECKAILKDGRKITYPE